jgi:conjugal transfer pilus assembly protein TraD
VSPPGEPDPARERNRELTPEDGHRRPPYWTLAAFAVLLVAPVTVAGIALLSAALGAAIVAVFRGLAARRARLRQQSEPTTSVGVALGRDRAGATVRLSDRQLSAHALIVGASGAGKSTTMLRIIADHVRRGRPVVAIDMKGSPAFARELADAAAAAGRPFLVWTPDGSSHWNPLQHGNAAELKDKLIATERFTEPHYQRAAERYVQTVLQVLLGAQDGRAPTLEAVVALMEPRRLSGMLRRLPRPAAARVQDYLATLTPDQLSAIRGLGTRLAVISESHIGPYLTPAGERDHGGTVDLRAALRGDEVVLFSLNSSTYGNLSAQIGTLALQDLVSAVGHRLGLRDAAGPPAQALIAIDEFSALGSDNVVSLLARGREAGASVLLATQELADLDRAARGLRDQVLGNTAVKLAHRQDVPASAQTIAQMAGTERVWEETQQIGGRLLGVHRTGRGTRRQVEQFIVHPNQITSLPTGEAVLITKLPAARAATVRVWPPPGRARGGASPPPGRERAGPELG